MLQIPSYLVYDIIDNLNSEGINVRNVDTRSTTRTRIDE